MDSIFLFSNSEFIFPLLSNNIYCFYDLCPSKTKVQQFSSLYFKPLISIELIIELSIIEQKTIKDEINE